MGSFTSRRGLRLNMETSFYVDDTLCLEDVLCRFVAWNAHFSKWPGTFLHPTAGLCGRSKIRRQSDPLSLSFSIQRSFAMKQARYGERLIRGNTWNSQQLFAHHWHASFFPSSQIGFVCGDNGEFAKTRVTQRSDLDHTGHRRRGFDLPPLY